jgi:NADH dehydrogenase/NADH:ubiquinone oxidoreductase subunit G
VPELSIDGQNVSMPEGATILDAIRKTGAHLPTLCHLEGLPPYGACRLCLVEIVKPEPEIIAACTYPVADGLQIDTAGTQSTAVRKMMLEFMLARCPTSDVIRELADNVGVKETRFSSNGQADELCILCGLCVRVCRDLVGAAALGFANRGNDRQVSTPFNLQSKDCIGCAACAAVCPTGAIHVEDVNGQRILHTWNTTIPLHDCPDCGEPFAPEPMSFLKEQVPVSAALWGKCPKCRRKATLAQLDFVSL